VQAYYDNKNGYISIRKSDIINVETEDRETIKLMLRWMIGDPIGDTKFDQQMGEPLSIPIEARILASAASQTVACG
jgi:hypothetical protein